MLLTASWMTPRLAISITFIAFGLTYGLWAGSSAAILARLDIGAGAYGLALTAFTGAYLAAMSAGGVIARKFTVKRVLLASMLCMGPVASCVLLAPAASVLISGLVVYGALAGLLDGAMNAEGARIERRLGKPIFLRLHGGASGGGAVGAIVGSWLSTSPAPWVAPLIAEASLLLAVFLVARAIAADAGDDAPSPSAAPTRFFTPTIVAIGLTIGVSIACESSAMSWSSLLLSREAPEWAALAGLGGAFFAACQAALRLNADVLRHHVSDRALIVTSLCAAALGFALVAAHAGFAITVIGFAIVGVGTGAVVPCGFALAATRSGVPAGAAISAVSFIGGGPRLPTPLFVGVIADRISMSAAFICLAVLLLAAVAGVLGFIPLSEPAASAGASTVPSGGSSS